MSATNKGAIPEYALDDFPWLTAQDVQLLYSIIERAESSSERPFRALFAAYDYILTENGISQAHDEKYLRFLLRMGELRREAGNCLFEQFRALLSKLNIEVDFDTPDRGRGSNAASVNDEKMNATAMTPNQGHGGLSNPALQRRASFESGYDVSTDRPSAQHAERPRSTDLVPQPSRSKVSTTTSRKQRPTETGRPQKRKVSFSEVQSGPKAQVKRLFEEDTDVTSSRSDADDEYQPSDDNFTQEVTIPLLNDMESNKEQEELAMNHQARTLRYHQLMAKALKIFRDWRHSAEAASRLHCNMEATAMVKDSNTLKRQVFDHWHVEFRASIHQKETERFFEGLEKRASAARDMFLLSKAFTHWAKCTEDEVIRTSAARRHILRTRFFNAWRDITVVNELKIRRVRLSRVMNIWKRRTAKVIFQEEQAKQHSRTQLISSTYRNWFWSFCERRAPFWYGAKHTQSIFNRWLEATRQNRVRTSIAESYRQTSAVQNALVLWSDRSTVVQKHLSEAEAFRGRKLLLPTVETLRKELQLVPLQGRVHKNVISRIARESLRTWYEKTALYARAKNIDELRIMRNSWTAWNDRLRCQVLQKAIDERVAVQALYKWVIAGRLALFQRVKGERMKHKGISIWTTKCWRKHNALEEAKLAVGASQNRRRGLSVLCCWRKKTEAAREASQQAQMIHDGQIAKAKFHTWSSKSLSLRRMQLCADDASFYVRGHNALHKWRAATGASRKSKRRDAFTHMRQKVKTATTRCIWQIWHDKTAAVVSAERQAEEFSERRLQNLQVSCFALWYSRTAELDRVFQEAYAHDARRLLHNQLQFWLQRHGELQLLNRQSAAFYAESTNESVASILRDTNWRLFRIKRLQETANSLAERNRKKHYRNMLRYWVQRTRRRQEQETLATGEENDDLISLASRSPSREQQQQLFRSSVSFMEPPTPRSTLSRLPQRSVSAFDPRRAAFASTNSAAVTPGYFKTPSRRTARSVARVLSFPNTPATTTQITPFMSRLHRSAVQQPFSHTRDSEPRVRSALPAARGNTARNPFASSMYGRANFDVGPSIPENSVLAESPLRRGNEAVTDYHSNRSIYGDVHGDGDDGGAGHDTGNHNNILLE